MAMKHCAPPKHYKPKASSFGKSSSSKAINARSSKPTASAGRQSFGKLRGSEVKI